MAYRLSPVPDCSEPEAGTFVGPEAIPEILNLQGSTEPCLEICLLEVGTPLKYTVPSFPVITVNLRKMKFKVVSDPGVYDGFIRDCSALERSYPAITVVGEGPKYCFFVSEEEFSQVMSLNGLILYDDYVFIMWKWEWGENVYTSDPALQIACGDDDMMSLNSKSSDSEVDENVSHAIVFKCIGSQKDLRSQEVLRTVSQKLEMGETVKVKLEPEPENHWDARAIAFLCELDSKWHRIGYVVKECVDAVHNALSMGQIVSTEFDWVKYIVHWSKSGPGWYAGVKVTKRGVWPNSAVKSASTI